MESEEPAQSREFQSEGQADGPGGASHDAPVSPLGFGVPLIVVVCLHLLTVGFFVSEIASRVHTAMVYPIDDAYIYMALGKNVAESGVWGVTRFAFSSASSAHLWTVLCSAAHAVSGGSELYPLVLNVVFSTSSLAYLAFLFARAGFRPVGVMGALLAVWFFTPMPSLAILGMEHSLHMFLVFLFTGELAERLTANRPSTIGSCSRLGLAAFLVSACRYESCFLIAIAALMLVLRRRWREAVAICVAGAAPILAYGAFSLSQGSHFLPNSILLKGRTGFVSHLQGGPIAASDASYLNFVGSQLYTPWALGLLSCLVPMLSWRAVSLFPSRLISGLRCLCLAALGLVVPLRVGMWYFAEAMPESLSRPLLTCGFVLSTGLGLGVMVLIALWLWRGGWSRRSDIWLIVAGAVMMMHIQTARVGWLFRYEAYFVGLVIVAALLFLKDRTRESTVPGAAKSVSGKGFALVRAMVAIGFLLLVPRAVVGNISVVPVAEGLYRQQYQMAHLIAKVSPEHGVVINDIGAISYFNNDVRIVDLFGLASTEVLDAKHQGDFDSSTIERFAKENGCRLAVVYEKFFDDIGGLPQEWRKIALWVTPHSAQGTDTVSIFTIRPEDADALRERLRAFPVPKDTECKVLGQ